MTITEFLLYLIYGYAMITMGIFAIVQKDLKLINVSLIKSLKYLGLFGIIHGISEWISMVIKLELCHPFLHPELYHINLVIKAISFVFLLYFGLDLLPLRNRYKKMVLMIPPMSLIFYLIGFFLLLAHFGADYHLANPKYNTIVLRYLMGFPSCIISAIALFINAKLIEKTKSARISIRYQSLAWVFIAYAFLEGLLVTKADYFPANLINKEMFIEFFEFTPLLIKAFVGFVIYILLIKVMDTFSWEQEDRLSRLEKLRIATEERRKLGLEIHDGIIQELFAAGLKIEYLSINKNGDRTQEILEQVKTDLSNTIHKVRQCISSTALDKIECEQLKDNLEQLVQKFSGNTHLKINLQCKISPYTIGHISPEKSTQIYYIIQEAITNALKHSEADYVDVLLEGRYDFLYITVQDNGKGISFNQIDPQKQFGIRSMRERAERVGGTFLIEKAKKGTRIGLKIPWEVAKHDE